MARLSTPPCAPCELHLQIPILSLSHPINRHFNRYAAFNTNVAASTGAIGWVLVDYIRTKGRFSVVGACEGAIAGLVGITPAAGYVSLWLAAVIGFLTAVTCASLQDLNNWLNIDEGLYVFKLHGVGGMVGSFLTGIFADQAISALDGSEGAPGGINGEGVQVGKQFAGITAISAWSFVVSCILLYALKYTPGMHLRISEEAEMRGLDEDQFFDEQIGDWEGFRSMDHLATHGKVPEQPVIEGVDAGTSSGSGPSLQQETAPVSEKKD